MTLTRFDIDPKGCMVPRPAGMLVLYDKHAAAAQQDEALIRQMLEALEQLVACHDEPDCPAVSIGSDAITAARARLGEKEGV